MQYGYLFLCFILAVVWACLWFFRKDLHREMLFTSFLFLPFGLTQPFFVPHYWHPVVIYKLSGLFDLESFLWCFFTGGIVAVLYEFVFDHHIKRIARNERYLHHAHIIYLFMILLALSGLYTQGMNILPMIRALFIIASILVIFLWWLRRDLFAKSLLSGFLFLALYISSLLVVNAIFPGFTQSQWNFNGTFGMYFFGIPIDEYLYALLFGLSWSVIFAEIKLYREA